MVAPMARRRRRARRYICLNWLTGDNFYFEYIHLKPDAYA